MPTWLKIEHTVLLRAFDLQASLSNPEKSVVVAAAVLDGDKTDREEGVVPEGVVVRTLSAFLMRDLNGSDARLRWWCSVRINGGFEGVHITPC